MQRKKPGPKPTGKGQMIGVRLQPDMLAVLDLVSKENAVSRPETLRYVFKEWAQSCSLLPIRECSNNKPVMVRFTAKEYSVLSTASEECFAETNVEEVIRRILRKWLAEKGYLPSKDGK